MIPRITHQIWLGQKKLPKKALVYREKLIELNPGWDHIFWDEEMVLKNGFGSNSAYNLSTNYGHKSDVLRYELMYKIGGIYLDIDFEPLKPLHPLLKYDSFLSYSSSIAQNAVIGSCEKNLFWGFVLNQLPGWVNHINKKTSWVVDITGPGFLAVMIERYRSNFGEEQITILPTNFFYPDVGNLKKDSSESYGIHWFWGTWFKTKI